ncbi:MAG: hypothetical protein JWR26_4861 [Pedosphaera sp.]|nr:hypothetical protein [Pedosphaera sp.]
MSHALCQKKRPFFIEPSIHDLMHFVLSGTDGHILVSVNPRLPGVALLFPRQFKRKKPKPNPPVKSKILTLALSLALTGVARAQTYSPVPLTPASFTQSIIVPVSTNFYLCNATSATMDAGTNNTGNTWYEQGYNVANPTTGLPHPGTTFTSLVNYIATNTAPITWSAPVTVSADTDADTNGTFIAAYDFSGTAGNNQTINGVTFLNSTVANGNAGTNFVMSGMNGGITGMGGTAAPWTALSTAYKAILNGCDYASSGSGTVTINNLTPGRMYEVQIWVDDPRSCCLGRTMNVTGGGGNTVLMQFNANNSSGGGLGQFSIGTFTANGTTESFTLTGSSTLNGQINAIQLRDLGAVGPSVNASLQYTMPFDYTTNNAVLIDSSVTSGSLTLSNEVTVTNISILNSAGNAVQTVNYAVHHDGGADETGTFSSPNWIGSSPALVSNGRIIATSATYSLVNSGNSSPLAYGTQIPVSGATPVTGITFTYPGTGSGHACIFALSGNGSGTNWTPMPVYGFNKDLIVEATAAQPGTLTNTTTATMDNGILNTVNTFYEMGFNRAYPATGLPHPGGTITSITHPNRSYTFASSYLNKANDAILINTNVQIANIVPVTPAPYTAFSVLSAGASIGTGTMTNTIIMQHSDGTAETNLFLVLDWFNASTVNKAYSAIGRINITGNPANFDGYGTNRDELYESTFQLANTVSPVTNIVLKFKTAPATNSTTYVFAVSATAGGLPPQIGTNPVSQTVYPSQTANFTASVSAGTAPLTNVWMVQSNGVYYPLANGLDANGSTISGANTTTLTISGVTAADGTNYQFMVTNAVGNATSTAALLTVYTTPPIITAQKPAASISTMTVFSNSTTPFSVTISGVTPLPYSYQWYNGLPQSPANAIVGATNASYANLNTASVTISCIVTSLAGSATSSPVTINLTSPTPYQSAIIAYNPVAYWPLNETSGTVAFDYAGNNNGTYVGGCTLGQPGLPATPGIGANTSVLFDGTSAYVSVPVGNLNITGPMTMIEWILSSAPTGTFTTSMGRSDASYRFDVDQTGLPHFADSGPDIIGPTPVTDGIWHQLVGVYDGTNQYLYVDGKSVAAPKASTPAGTTFYSLYIGGDGSYSPGTRLFPGNITQVAVLTNALSAAQVASVYYSLDTAPTVHITPANPSIYAGSSVVLTAVTNGTPPIALQWFAIDTFSNSNNIPGATNGTYTIANASLAQNGYTYGVNAANAYGTNTATTSLTVQNGPPYFPTGGDISPLSGEAYAGAPVTYTVNVLGSAPLFYQWLIDGLAVNGATNASFTAPAVCGLHSIQVSITNSASSGFPTVSSLANLQGDSYPTNITLNTDGTGWQLNTAGFGAVPSIVTNVLELTDGGTSEAASAFYKTAQYVGSFTASFTYTDLSFGGADGAAFIVQNSSSGFSALGAGGGGLGYGGVSNSSALEINLYGFPGIAPGTNGNTYGTGNGIVYQTTGPVSVTSGHPINFVLNYANGILAVTLTDATTLATYSTNYSIASLTQTLGGTDLAYVGFSGGTGGVASRQHISNFEFNSVIPPVTLAVAPGAPGTLVLSWPSADPSYVLQQATSIDGPVTWLAGPAPVVVGGVNQATVTVAPNGNMFYRLARVVCP